MNASDTTCGNQTGILQQAAMPQKRKTKSQQRELHQQALLLHQQHKLELPIFDFTKD